MKKSIESILELISDMEAISQEDELSCLIDSELNDELFEDELEGVFAAGSGSSNFGKFEEELKRRGIN